MSLSRIVSEVAAEMGLVPLAWLAWLHVTARRRDPAWWWLAGAFGVSWLADLFALWVDPWFIGTIYPVSQAGIIGAVFLSRQDAIRFALVLVGIAGASIVLRGGEGPDVLLRTVAMLGVAGIVWDRWSLGRLRTALLVYFGLGLVAWWWYVGWPGWPSWLVYQGTRAVGIAFFCAASLRPAPDLRLK